MEGGGDGQGGKRGMTGVSSRAGEITHFDGIKMSVFPTPICGEIARNRALRRRERKRERKRERERTRKRRREGGFLPPLFSRGPPLRRGWLFYERKKRRESASLSIDGERFFGRRPERDSSTYF